MAKVTFGPTISEARGSIGTVTFARNRYGAFARHRTAPVQTRTPPRAAQRDLYKALMLAWQGITDNQRLGWAELAENNPRTDTLGQRYRISGCQQFMRNNSLLAQAGVAHLSDAPANMNARDCGNINILQAGTTPASLLISVDSDPTAAEAIELWCSNPLNLGRVFFENRLKLITTETTVGPWDIGAAYVARFGTISTQKNIAARVRLLNLVTGAPGPWRSQLRPLMPPPVNFADNETPTGLINGINLTYTLVHTPNPALSLALYRNGLFMFQGVDYTLAGQTITMAIAPSIGDTLVAFYRY